MEKYKVDEEIFKSALEEIRTGKKLGHWIWYIFPQIKGLGYSETCKFYELQSLNEAKAFLNDDLLRQRLIMILKVLLSHRNKDICTIMGELDSIKLLSCMTLFKYADEENKKCRGIFQEVINTFYFGNEDQKTINILNNQKYNKQNVYDRETQNNCRCNQYCKIPVNQRGKTKCFSAIKINENNNIWNNFNTGRRNQQPFSNNIQSIKMNNNIFYKLNPITGTIIKYEILDRKYRRLYI